MQCAPEPVAARTNLIVCYRERYANPWGAAERGYLDDVIEPAETSKKLIAGFQMLESNAEDLPKRKHGNVPL